jgi:hypothetical protein
MIHELLTAIDEIRGKLQLAPGRRKLGIKN